MALLKREYKDGETVITAQNMNDIQDAVIMLEDGLFTVDNEKSGEAITITDAARRSLRSLILYGKTTQAGTPSPEAPVELVSVGSAGSITVSVTGEGKTQRMTIATPNGLPGIPVASGGNYTDANGQQWICDEIDLARGVYVKRNNIVTPRSAVRSYDNSSGTNRVVIVCDDAVHTESNAVGAIMCDSLPTESGNDQYSTNKSGVSNVYGGIAVTIKDVKTESEVIQWLAENPIKIQYILATPIETPLTPEEYAAYGALYTYKNNTTVSNDAGAWMDLEYVMDTKEYLESLAKPPIRMVNVVLSSAKWVGADNLYSQVVNIAGITENSQINLTPSVEQLAIFYEKDITFVTENDGGVVTVYVIGQKPQNNYTIQANIVEVSE